MADVIAPRPGTGSPKGTAAVLMHDEADDTYGKDWPRCPHGKQLTVDGCPQCLREARKLAAGVGTRIEIS